MKSFRFLMTTGIILLVAFTIGSIVGLSAGVTPNITGIMAYVGQVVVKFTLAVAVFFLAAWIVAIHLGTTLGRLVASMHDRADYVQENLSPVAVLGGLMLAVGQIVALAHASTFPVYMYEALTKGSVGLALGILATAVIGVFVGVRSFNRFTEFFYNAKNNQLVIFMMVALNTAVLIAMLS